MAKIPPMEIEISVHESRARDENRVRIFWIDSKQLMALLGLLSTSIKSVRPTCCNLPVDAQVLAVEWSFQRQAFGVVVEHASFEPVTPGTEIPWLDRLDIRIEDSPADKQQTHTGVRLMLNGRAGNGHEHVALFETGDHYVSDGGTDLDNRSQTAADDEARLARGGWF